MSKDKNSEEVVKGKAKRSTKAGKESGSAGAESSSVALESGSGDVALNVEHFEGARVAVDVTREARCRVAMKVVANGSLMEACKKAAIRGIAREVSVPGFRKGKAPASLIEKKFGRDLAQGWEREFANLSFKEAQELARIPLLNGNGNVTYKVEKLTLDGGQMLFHFESEPVVPALDFGVFDLPNEKAVVIDDAKIDETIKSIRMFYATWDQVTDRGAEEGDFVVLDIDDMDQDPPVQAFSNTRFEVNKSGMATWMRKLVLGKKVGESVEGVSEPEKDDSEEVKNAFQKKRVKLHVKGVEHAKLPPLDDELAQKVGVQSVSELRERLGNLLKNQAAEMHAKSLREKIGEQLIERVPFDVPASVLEREANHRIAHMLKNATFAKKWKESMSEEEKAAQKADVTKQSENAIRLFYLCRRIVSDNKISLSEEELSPNYQSVLEMMFADPSRINYRNQSKEQQAAQFSKFMMEKAQDFVVNEVLKRSSKG